MKVLSHPGSGNLTKFCLIVDWTGSVCSVFNGLYSGFSVELKQLCVFVWVFLPRYHFPIISQSNPVLSRTFWLVLTACNPNACRASGRGLQPKGLRVKEVADFKVYTKGAGSGELKVTVKGPSETPRLQTFICDAPLLYLRSRCDCGWCFYSNPEGLEEPVKVLEMESGVYECNYYPITMGKYIVIVTWGGHNIPRRWDVTWAQCFPVTSLITEPWQNQIQLCGSQTSVLFQSIRGPGEWGGGASEGEGLGSRSGDRHGGEECWLCGGGHRHGGGNARYVTTTHLLHTVIDRWPGAGLKDGTWWSEALCGKKQTDLRGRTLKSVVSSGLFLLQHLTKL